MELLFNITFIYKWIFFIYFEFLIVFSTVGSTSFKIEFLLFLIINVFFFLPSSFCDCYEADIGPLPVVGNFIVNKEESFEVSFGANQTLVSKGVPLEHLIACIAGVEVAKSVLCIKKVQWLENRTDGQGSFPMSI